MSLNAKITEELKTAMKAGDQKTTGLLRFLIAQVKNKEIEKHGAGKPAELTDEEMIDLFRKEAKKRKEAISLFEQGGRKDLADKEREELLMIERYLPRELSREEIEAVVNKIKNSGVGEFGILMKQAMAEFKGQADGKLVSEIIKEALK